MNFLEAKEEFRVLAADVEERRKLSMLLLEGQKKISELLE